MNAHDGGYTDGFNAGYKEGYAVGVREGLTLPPVLVDYEGAARLLATTREALAARVSRGDNKLTACVVRNGRSVRFSVAKLAEKYGKGRS